MRRIALLVLLGVCVGSGAFAQQARVQVAPAPHYVGEPVHILVSVDGLEEEPTPEVQSASSGGGRLRLAGISPKVSQSISIVNGRVSRTREVTHVFEFHYEASEPGSVTVGPIQISQGGVSLSIRPIRLEVGRPPTRDDIAI